MPAHSIALTAILANPAPILINTNMVNLDVRYRGTYVGKAYIDPLNLIPGGFRWHLGIVFDLRADDLDCTGTNNLATEFRYMVSRSSLAKLDSAADPLPLAQPDGTSDAVIASDLLTQYLERKPTDVSAARGYEPD